MKTRILTTGNPTPIKIPNIRWVNDGKYTSPDKKGYNRFVYDFDAYNTMVDLGYESAFMAYAGTFNQASMWDGGDALISDIPTKEACQSIGKLITRPQTYRPNKVPSHGMVIIDIEASKILNGVNTTSPLVDRVAALQGFINIVRWIKSTSNIEQEVCIYMDNIIFSNCDGHEPEIKPLFSELNSLLAMRCGSLYFWDWEADDIAFWNADVDQIVHNIMRYSPEHEHTKIMVINPMFAVYWPQADLPSSSKLDGTPIPLSIWKSFTDTLVEKGFNLMIWTGNQLVEPIREHLYHVAGYRR